MKRSIKELIEELISHLSIEKIIEYIKYIYLKDKLI